MGHRLVITSLPGSYLSTNHRCFEPLTRLLGGHEVYARAMSASGSACTDRIASFSSRREVPSRPFRARRRHHLRDPSGTSQREGVDVAPTTKSGSKGFTVPGFQRGGFLYISGQNSGEPAP